MGSFDGQRFVPEAFQHPDCGTDFYAPQTFVDGKGRRIMIGWLYNWNREVPEGAVRTGALTIPRELTLRDGVLYNFPVEEVRHMLTDTDGHVLRENGVLKITNGSRILLECPEAEAGPVAVLRDTRTCEVFLNGGRKSCTFYFN